MSIYLNASPHSIVMCSFTNFTCTAISGEVIEMLNNHYIVCYNFEDIKHFTFSVLNIHHSGLVFFWDEYNYSCKNYTLPLFRTARLKLFPKASLIKMMLFQHTFDYFPISLPSATFLRFWNNWSTIWASPVFHIAPVHLFSVHLKPSTTTKYISLPIHG